MFNTKYFIWNRDNIKNNFVLYQGDTHIRNVYNLFEKIMSERKLTNW